uniref:Saposin B-type domain-containing protein n=1 Tax=Trichobilharzia regenti TaxID=157069 RepID=A0AA85K8B9_TRIRE|nr:unnamed protein product [Trichobilharzia regenti]
MTADINGSKYFFYSRMRATWIILCAVMVDATVQLGLNRKKLDFENHGELLREKKLIDEMNKQYVDVCSGCTAVVLSLKLILHFETVVNYVNVIIDRLCIFVGPYSSECTFVAQNFASKLIDLLENATVPRICQKWRMCQ